ncbi:MAG: M1 family metallopeptidase [Gemmatimonadota bacterium]|nr:MAG: M1 family metallopeptidase [Gemmatimonadota bacterium]
MNSRRKVLTPVFYAAFVTGLVLSALSADASLMAQEYHAATSASADWAGPSPFRQLDLPAPSALRTGAGRPGPDYWQQRVDYTIRATLDVTTHTIEGSERIRYVNNSPGRLAFLWLQVDGNVCGLESVANLIHLPPLVFGAAVVDFTCRSGSGVRVSRVESDGQPLSFKIHDTTMRIDLPAPIEPAGELEFEVDWSWEIPEHGFARVGRDGTLYQVAAWYPRLMVYDDLSGWNIEPFLGPGEFYLEYGDFDVQLTVPASYLVTATGELQNPEDVLTSEQRSRLARARISETPVAVVTAEEARASAERQASGTRTWQFRAEDVRDFAFAAAPDFRWDATYWDGVLIQTFYRPEALPWEEAIRMSHQTIRYYSERLARYPYPHATTVEGPIGGMEYPMMTFVPSTEVREDLYFVLTHEFGHEWFPMMVGSNERVHVWMDEGFNTFINIGAVKDYFAGEPYADTVVTHLHNLYARHSVPGEEQPISLPPNEQADLYWTAYQKPAFMMHLLRTEVLGEERFDRAFSEYVAAWNGKHPSPADFFRMIEDGAGMDLDWFWRGWIYTTSRLDQAISDVSEEDDGRAIHVRSLGEMVMPAELRITYADGSTETVRLPVEMWYQGPEFVYRARGTVTAAEVDPRGVYPDDDRENNRWPRSRGTG